MSTSGSIEKLTMSQLMLGDEEEEEEEAPEASTGDAIMIPYAMVGLPRGASDDDLVSYKPEVGPPDHEDLVSEVVEEASSSSCIDVSYKQEIRPLLDVVDRLRNLDITKEGIQLPSIVVVGDQSSGKSSVLESLAGIKLPRGQGICTRVPLVMRLKSCKDGSQASISIEHLGKVERIEEYEITEKIKNATVAIAGNSSGISFTPITLEVVRKEAPDLTMVDLPGITRVAIAGQPPDIYEQISEIIIHYITPNESIILNVISADVDFSTCESIKMSKLVDERGERTLAVVTKCDKAPEGLLEKVTMNSVNIRLGYVCVRNRVGDETMEEARKREKVLFDSHTKLKKIDKSIVGIPALATKLMQIQARSINKSLPTIVKKIDSMLSERQAELTDLPPHLCNPREADVVFVKLLNSMKESLNKILIEGDFKQFQDDRHMHCTARLREMFESYYNDLRKTASIGGKFLAKETEMLDEAKGVGLPNFMSRPVFLNLLQRLVEQITERSLELVFKVWEYMENVVMQVIDFYCHCFPQLQTDARRVVQDLIQKMKIECENHVKKLIQMEKLVDFTLSPFYMETYGRLLTSKVEFMERLRDLVAENGSYGRQSGNSTVLLDGVGEVDVSEIMEVPTERVEEAYDMQMSVLAYWKVVTLRMGDGVPMYLQFVCRNLVMTEFNFEILTQVGGPRFGAMEQLLVESPLVADKRRNLTSSIDLLRESKTTVATIMDRIAKV